MLSIELFSLFEIFYHNARIFSSFYAAFLSLKNIFFDNFCDTVLKKCTAVVCYNDEIAYYLVKTLLSKGINIPDDIAIVSFDNSQLSELSPLKITSLAHGTRRIGQKAAMQILNLIDKKEVPSEKVSWTLVEKETS